MYTTVNGYTKQSIIDKIKNDFKGKAWNGAGCDYLNEEGKKCAVGLFIPNGHKGQRFESDSYELFKRYPDLISKMPLGEEAMGDFQLIHDRLLINSPIEEQKDRLIRWIKDNVKG